MKLYDGGAYLVNGVDVVADTPEAEAKVQKLTGRAVAKADAKKETIAYSILQKHNTSGNMDKLQVRFDKLSINLTNYELVVNGVRVDTPPKELELIYHLASNPNRVYTRDQLLDEVWGFDYYGDSRTVDVHVKRLREKLENVSEEWCLKTVWGVGYKFETLKK